MKALFCYTVVIEDGSFHLGNVVLDLPDKGLTEEALDHARDRQETRVSKALNLSRDSLSVFFTSITKLDE